MEKYQSFSPTQDHLAVKKFKNNTYKFNLAHYTMINLT